MNTANAIDTINTFDDWWVKKSRVNFLAYRRYMRHGNFMYNWFVIDLCSKLQQFYVDFKAGKRPVLLIQSPPQHGKSIAAIDFISWVVGLDPTLRIIYASYSDILGKRCNLAQQRLMANPKYQAIFPDTALNFSGRGALKTTTHLEYVDKYGVVTGGQFRNTTINGSVTGESLDIGVIDDSVKGREQAESIVISQKIWEWFTDDFMTRFSDLAGLIVIMTRWTTHDVIARILEEEPETPVINYPALATHKEESRDADEPLFPELKSKEFLLKRKKIMPERNWESLYQGAPTVSGGNIFKDEWWKWWRSKPCSLPKLKFKYIVADTAQKEKAHNDWTVFQCWGYGRDNNIYLLDKLRIKAGSPVLRKEAEAFYRKHFKRRIEKDDPLLRGMYIEDKSSGSGLIQELRKKRIRVIEVQRQKDKVLRAEDAAIFVETGRVYLNTEIDNITNLTKEAREFPASNFDDDVDTLITAVELAFITNDMIGSLKAAMEAD